MHGNYDNMQELQWTSRTYSGPAGLMDPCYRRGKSDCRFSRVLVARFANPRGTAVRQIIFETYHEYTNIFQVIEIT
jgi:hypothetical protein